MHANPGCLSRSPLLRPLTDLPRLTTLVTLATMTTMTVMTAAAADEPNWPQFRGPGGQANAAATSDDAAPPVAFGTSSGVAWSTDLPRGHSSPAIWGDRIYVTGLHDGKLETLSLDRSNGTILWRKTAPVEKLEPTHSIGSPAASTPVTDGHGVFVYFGSYGLIAYDEDGRERWKQPMPTPMVEFGAATSPILAGDRLILICDQDQGSHLLALDKATGRQIWRTERPEFRRSFSSPFVWQHDGDQELVVPGSIWLRSYDLKDGRERWSYSGTSRVANSTPSAGDDLLFNVSWNLGGDPGDRITLEPFESFARAHDTNKDGKLTRDEIPPGPVRERFNQLDLNKDGFATAEEWQVMADMFARAGNALIAIRPGGHGDITRTHVAWKSTRSLPYVSSPVYHRGRVYTVKNGGLASCYDAKTGKVCYQDERLDAGGDYYASLVAAAGRIYAISQRGVVVVIQAGDTLKVLARNELHEDVMSTPAIVGDTIYVRTASKLYAFGR